MLCDAGGVFLVGVAHAVALLTACIPLVLIGVVAGFGNVNVVTLTQKNVSKAMMGRVMSLIVLAEVGLTPVSNALAGVLHPAEVIPPHVMTLFLRAPSDHPRNRKRLDMTRKTYMLEGLNVDSYTARGDSPIAHIWTALHFGDYMAYYLAMAYGVDPTPVTALESFKAALKEQ